jgi:hypothetical protein
MSKKNIIRPGQENLSNEKSLPVLFARNWKIIVPAFVLIIVLIGWTVTRPAKGGMYYGLCRVFMETQVRFPNTIKLTSAEWIERSLRIYFTHIDAYGGTRSEMFECTYNKDAKLFIREARRNRIAVDPQKVTNFNKTIPYVIAAKPDLTLPPAQSDDLMGLQQD